MKNLILRYTLSKFSVIILLLLGACVWLWCLPEFSDTEDSGGQVNAGDTILAAGTVVGIEEKENAYHQKQTIVLLHSVTFCNSNFQQDKKQIGEGVLCYLNTGEIPPFYGQQVLVSGIAGSFSVSRNPGEFDVSFYYRTKGLDFYLEKAEIKRCGESYDVLRHGLYRLRCRLREHIFKICGEDAGIMCSLLLGEKAFLAKQTKELYQSGGISHILAISGVHISFLGVGLYRLLRKLWLQMHVAAIVSGILLMLYVIMTGAAPSACRAGTMFLFCMLADVTGRSYDRRTALAFSALLQILQNPLLFGQSGFWLSYGAVFGLEILLPILQNIWKNRVYRLFASGISVFLITFPVLLISYYEFPIYSFFLNLFVIPLMSVVMAVGLLSLLAGFFWVSLGQFLFYPVHMILWCFESGCRICMRLPGNQWIVGKPQLWRMVLYCVLLLFFCLLGYYMAKTTTLLTLLGAVWILTGAASLNGSITCLDVGQGDGIVIRDINGYTVMIDGGSSSKSGLAEYTLLPYLKSQGIRKLDYVFLTHADEDHISAIKWLLETEHKEVEIQTLVLPKLSSPDEAYMEMVRLAGQADVRTQIMKSGEALTVGDMKFYCLHPKEGVSYPDKNEASLVLYLQMNDVTALFTGDMDGEAERRFAEDYPKQLGGVTLLKVGHHGSADSCSGDFLKAVNPRYAVISCGENNRYGHPALETLERLEKQGSEIWVTAEYGAVILETGKNPMLKSWLKSNEAKER